VTYRILHFGRDPIWRRDRAYTLRDVQTAARRDGRQVRDGYRRWHVRGARKLIVIDPRRKRPDVVLVANPEEKTYT